jgi:hypothetical protein
MSLDRLLQHQSGVITLRQTVGLGIAKQTVHRRAREGCWTRLRPSAYLVGGHRLTEEVRARAAWLWAGDDAAASGPAAAYWHGLLDRAPADIDLTVPHRHKPRAHPGLTVRRRDLHHVDLIDTRGVRVTAVPLTVLETAVALPGDRRSSIAHCSGTSASPRPRRPAARGRRRDPHDPRRGGLTTVVDRRIGDIRPVYEPHVPISTITPDQAGRRCWGMRSCRVRVVSVARWKWPCRDRAQR